MNEYSSKKDSQIFSSTFPKSNLTILQDKSLFCFGIDAVLLANFSHIKKDENAFDLGSGNGIIPLLMSRSTQAKHFTALEIQSESANLALENVKINHLEEKIEVILGDIKNTRSLFKPECADVVTCNPPYAKENEKRKNPNESKNIARHEVLCNLEDVISSAAYLLKSGGSFFMIHRPERLSEIFLLFSKYRLEPKTLQLVYPFVDSSPTMIMIEGRKNARSELKILPPLVIYKEKGEYTEAVKEIYERF